MTALRSVQHSGQTGKLGVFSYIVVPLAVRPEQLLAHGWCSLLGLGLSSTEGQCGPHRARRRLTFVLRQRDALT